MVRYNLLIAQMKHMRYKYRLVSRVRPACAHSPYTHLTHKAYHVRMRLSQTMYTLTLHTMCIRGLQTLGSLHTHLTHHMHTRHTHCSHSQHSYMSLVMLRSYFNYILDHRRFNNLILMFTYVCDRPISETVMVTFLFSI